MTREKIERELEQARTRREALAKAHDRFKRLAAWLADKRLKAFAKAARNQAERAGKAHAEVMDRIDKLRGQLKAFGDTPSWLPAQHADYWNRPWDVPLDGADDFKALLWSHGLLSPNFTRREAGGQDRHPQGCAVPDSLRHNAQRHAFSLERARHQLGDKAMGAGSWYRCPPHNSAVGGASASQHMQANATDWFSSERARLGGERFDQVMESVFSGGGRGYQSYVGGPIRHADNGPARTWVYA